MLSSRRRFGVLAICCMSLLIVGMDATIVNVALPVIGRDLSTGVTGLQWVVDAYTVVLASLLILAGSLGDRFGRKRTFQVGLLLFVSASVACSLAPSLPWLVAFRMVQAVGGSMLNPVALSIVTNVFTDPRERARAIGIWAGVVGLGLGLGPVAGGALTGTLGWRAIFWINLPIGLAAVVLAALFVPESRAPRARRLDPVGQVLVVTVLAGLTYAIIEAPLAGVSSPRIVAPCAAAALAFVLLLRVESRRVEPLIELGFFRSVPFAGATVTAVCAFAAFSGFLFLTTLYLQEVRGLSPLAAGLLLSPMAVMVVIGAPLAGRWVGARGPRLPLVAAGVLMTAGAALLLTVTAATSYAVLVLGFVVFAAGFGVVNPPITNAAVSGMPRERAGVAAAIASTSRQVGASLGVAVVGSLAHAAGGPSAGARPGWIVVVACGCAVTVLAVVTTSARAVRTGVAAGDAPVALPGQEVPA